MISLSHALVVCTVVSKTSRPVALIGSPFAALAGDVAGPGRSFFSADGMAARQLSRPARRRGCNHAISSAAALSDPWHPFSLTRLYSHRVGITLTGVNSPLPGPGVRIAWLSASV